MKLKNLLMTLIPAVLLMALPGMAMAMEASAAIAAPGNIKSINAATSFLYIGFIIIISC